MNIKIIIKLNLEIFVRKRLINLVVFFLFFSWASIFEAANAQEITIGVPYTSCTYYPYYYQNSYT